MHILIVVMAVAVAVIVSVVVTVVMSVMGVAEREQANHVDQETEG